MVNKKHKFYPVFLCGFTAKIPEIQRIGWMTVRPNSFISSSENRADSESTPIP